MHFSSHRDPNHLSNEDFRKLLQTPRSHPSNGPVSNSTKSADVIDSESERFSNGNAVKARRQRKDYHAQLTKEKDLKIQDLSEKYRDRASERRQGVNPDYATCDDPIATTAFKAVAPDLKSFCSAAEKRKQLIQQSKYLGGDVKHTHLVKGLDYALLQKVRKDMQQKDAEEEKRLEQLALEKEKTKRIEDKKTLLEKTEDEGKFKTKMGLSIYRIVQDWKSRKVNKHELFTPGRMSYVIDLDDSAESDVPTTVLRSVADIPSFSLSAETTNNDIVINKLTQILTYVRHGKSRRGKHKKAIDDIDESANAKANKVPEIKKSRDSIYGDIGEYVPPSRKSKPSHSTKQRSYFINQYHTESIANSPVPIKLSRNDALSKLNEEPEAYAECYPGLEEMNDAIGDSDDETDYSKMDLGNRKGTIGRWDFDTAEEYSDYMNQKEALPKAAFQYGVKMADGRRSRKNKDRNERLLLDKEWQKIQKIIRKKN